MARDYTKVEATPGRVYWGITSTTPPTFGGVDLGYTKRGFIVRSQRFTTTIESEETGKEKQDDLFLGEVWTVETELIQWDDNTIAAAFANSYTRSGGTSKMMAYPGNSVLIGQKMAATIGKKLLFVPDDSSKYYYLFRLAVPDLKDGLPLRATGIKSLRITWDCYIDRSLSAGDDLQKTSLVMGGTLSDLQAIGLS